MPKLEWETGVWESSRAEVDCGLLRTCRGADAGSHIAWIFDNTLGRTINVGDDEHGFRSFKTPEAAQDAAEALLARTLSERIERDTAALRALTEAGVED